MTDTQTAPYGAWRSPITVDMITADSVGLGEPHIDGDTVYWIENRASENGRSVVVRRAADGSTTDLVPPPFNARTRVHEYGGGAYTVANGVLFFSNFSDNRLYRVDRGGEPRPITPEANVRYGDLLADQQRNRLICVREDHSKGGEAVNELVAVDMDGQGEVTVLRSGSDFYGYATLSPDGTRLAWLEWQHPNMPWDGTELWLGELAADGSITNAVNIAGGRRESIFQPQWGPDGTLFFVSDRTGWWNMYRWHNGEAQALAPMEAEWGVPQWVFGMSTYGIDADGHVIATVSKDGIGHVVVLEPDSGHLTWVPTPFTSLDGIRVQGHRAVFLGGMPTAPTALYDHDLRTGDTVALRRSSDLEIDKGYLSEPQSIEFPTENGLTAYGIFYPPKNKLYHAPDGELPPLIVKSHGGPTSATSAAFDLRIQYWTSRGFAVLDVDYGGSTGYGREYRERLYGQWGVVDVDDCVNGARYLADQGLVDGERLAITGGSAGGYTTLCALTFRDAFKAGASYFGLSELEVFVRDTHKFESRYLEQLVGPYPEKKALYKERSPINYVDQINAPMIFLQGLDDKVVPPNQSELVVDVLRNKGLPVALLEFEGEGHGFRRAETIKRALEAELYFYGRVFGFMPADEIDAVDIENMA
ncbi:MAG TPA: S9 family peptidase [Roseiflexaceae bacterium]|nr:S9 family peptidase [Roseiflexaceae bacterium]